jgi:hypothetical protein
VAWAPRSLRDTKFAAGYGVYYDQIALAAIVGPQDQVSLSTFYSGGVAEGAVETAFLANQGALQAPRYQNASLSVERKLPHEFYGKAGYTIRDGSRGFAYTPLTPVADLLLYGNAFYRLSNSRRDRYDAFDFSVRRTFAGQFEWSAGYTRSATRTNEVVDYSLENPIFASQMGGPFPWDTPNRFHMWGWAPLPERRLPRRLQFLARGTTAAYLMEYRTGFPFSIVDEDGFLVGRADGSRLPSYFNVNIALERKFRALHYLWAWRAGIDNVTNNGNPNVVNNVIGTPAFLTYGRGQQRALNVRLRFLGKK